MRQKNTSGAGFTACAVFFVILYNGKLYNSGVFLGVLRCAD